jgi:hypothetical protein
MARAKLSGSLLGCRDAPPATTPTQDLGTMRQDAGEKALGGPVLVWSTGVTNEAEPNTAEDASDAVDRAAAAPQAAVLDPPVVEVTAGMASGDAVTSLLGRPDGRSRALRWSVSRAVAVAISGLAVGSVSALLFLQPSDGKHSTETALSIAPLTTTGKSTSGVVEPELQPPLVAVTVDPPRGAPDLAGATAVFVPAGPNKTLPDNPSADAPGSAPVVASADSAVPGNASPAPEVSGGAPRANLPAGAADSSTASTEPPASAAFDSTLLERGDSLFAIGDFTAARLFYERAANTGDGQAALRLGATFDPAFLTRSRFIGARGNAAKAAYWYQRADKLGVSEAEILLKAVAAEPAH